ncbi:MAG: DUF2878 domain-containing protein [Desulfuromonadales bacterium]
MNDLTRKVINVVLFQVAWFAAVLGAARGMLWLGPLAMVPTLAVHLALQDDRRAEVKLLLAAGLLGLIFDTAFVAGGVFTPLQHLFPRPFSPPWMICLWLNFAATLNVSMAWLLGRYRLAALFGAIGGPLAYYSGAKLGATETLPTTAGMLLLAIGWGFMTPLLALLAKYFTTSEPFSISKSSMP